MRKLLFGLLLLLAVTSGCKIAFNFHGGGAVDPNLKTISILTFANDAALAPPYTSQLFTQQLQERFLAQSRLTLTDDNPNVEVSGSLTDYRVTSVAVQGNVSAAQNRLTIGVKVSYRNTLTPNESWEKSFSAFTDFDAARDFSSIEREKIEEVVPQLTQQIFNESLGKW